MERSLISRSYGGNYYLNVAKGIWDKKKKKPVVRTVLLGSIDENGTFMEKKPKRMFSSSMVYEYGNSQLVWNLCHYVYKIIEKHHIEIIETGSGSG